MTEGAVTMPWSEASGCVPLIHLAYFEFKDEEGKLWKLHEIKEHQIYTLVTSQKNGFLRYDTQDLVKVTGFYHQTPVLEFIGRSGQYSDLAGEKFSETMLRDLCIKDNFLIVPDDGPELPRYQIFTENADYDWEKTLRLNYHYNLAREIHQLSPLVIKKVNDVNALYLKFFQDQGMILGDVKERILLHDLKLARKFLEWTEKEIQS